MIDELLREINPAIHILGAGGFARETYLSLNKGRVIYLTDDKALWGTEITGGTIVGSIESYYPNSLYHDPLFIPGIGNPETKKKLVDRALNIGYKPLPFLSSYSIRLNRSVDIGKATVICQGVCLTVDISIGNYVNLNLNCTVGHDTVIKDFVNVSPGVNISGNCKIEESVDIGTGVSILPGVTIGKGSVIGAGAVVTKDIPPHSVAVGVPAKVIKTLEGK